MTPRIRALIVSVPLALFVAGCGWSKIDTMKDMKPTGSKFYKALYSEYVKVGDREAKEDGLEQRREIRRSRHQIGVGRAAVSGGDRGP